MIFEDLDFVIFYYLPDFIVCLLLLHEILGNMCIEIICQPGYDDMNFEMNLSFLIKPFFLHNQKVMIKT